MNARIRIRYCKNCKWMLRSAWMAQEILATFENEIDQVTLIPSSGGVFEIHANDQRIWSREEQGGFPEIKQLKTLVRDAIAPEKNLGHIDRAT